MITSGRPFRDRNCQISSVWLLNTCIELQMKIKWFLTQDVLFHFWSITRSSVVCNFTNEWKLLVSRGGSRFSFCYIVIGGDKPWVWRVWVYPCRPHLFADKVITDVTAYVCIKCVSGFKVGWEYNVQEKIKEILNSRLFKVIYDLTYGN